MFPLHCMPENLVLLMVNRREVFLSGLLNISFQNSLYNQRRSTTYYPFELSTAMKTSAGLRTKLSATLVVAV